VELHLAKLGPKARVVACLAPRGFELVERGHESLGHVASAEIAVDAPAARAVGIEQRVGNGRRARRDVRSIEASGPGTLREERNSQRVLPGSRTDRSGRASGRGSSARRSLHRMDLHARCHVDAHGRNREHSVRHVARIQAAGQDDRDLARHGDRDLAGDLAAGPSGERASGGVENEPFGAGCEVRLACLD
jgi:hypothetical protein